MDFSTARYYYHHFSHFPVMYPLLDTGNFQETPDTKDLSASNLYPLSFFLYMK